MNKTLFFNVSIFFPIGFILAFREANSLGDFEIIKFFFSWAIFSVPLLVYISYKAIEVFKARRKSK